MNPTTTGPIEVPTLTFNQRFLARLAHPNKPNPYPLPTYHKRTWEVHDTVANQTTFNLHVIAPDATTATTAPTTTTTDATTDTNVFRPNLSKLPPGMGDSDTYDLTSYTTTGSTAPSAMEPIFQNCLDPALVLSNAQYRRLYIGSLDENMTYEVMKELFKTFGKIDSVEHRPPRPGARNGFCFITYNKYQSVYDALTVMGAYTINGQHFKVSLPRSTAPIDPNYKPETYLIQWRDTLLPKWHAVVEEGKNIGLFSQVGEYERLLTHYDYALTQSEGSGGSGGAGGDDHGGGDKVGYKIYVGGGFYGNVTEDMLYGPFSTFGPIIKVTLIRNADGSLKGYGFIEYEREDDAKKAIEAMNGVDFGTKKLMVNSAKNEKQPTTASVPNVPLLFDLNFTEIPDPLATKYPNLPPLQHFALHNILRLDGMYTTYTPQEQHQLATNPVVKQAELDLLKVEMSGYGTLEGPIILRRESYNDCGVPCPEENKSVVVYVTFSSCVGSFRCYELLNNRLFCGHPIKVKYVEKIYPLDLTTGALVKPY